MLEELDPQARSLRVFPRERERVRRGVDRSHARSGELVRDRERDRPCARAHVEHGRRLDPGEQREAPLDDDLRLGPRDQRPLVDP